MFSASGLSCFSAFLSKAFLTGPHEKSCESTTAAQLPKRDKLEKKFSKLQLVELDRIFITFFENFSSQNFDWAHKLNQTLLYLIK